MSRTVEQIQFAPRIPKPLRVAAYARVSSGKDAMLHSLAAQVDHYSTFIRHHHGWEYVGVYADEAKTGTRDSRENFQRMIADCRAGRIDHIITKSISRFSRNTVTLLETVRELKGLGISVYFEEQSIDTATADGELMLSVLASYAQEESLSASENQKWRVKRNFEEGIPWRFFMLGYCREGDKLVIVPEEAEIVRSIFDDFLAGKGITAIAKRLNESGYVTRSGCVFHKSAVERILRNYAYTGNLLLQTKFRENHLTKVTRKNQGELPRYHAADTHEAIIPLDTFNAVQMEIQQRKEKYAPGKPRQTSHFTGLITCAICGKHYRHRAGLDLRYIQFLRQSPLFFQSNPGGNTDAGRRPGRAHGQNNGDYGPQRQSPGVHPRGRNRCRKTVAEPLPCRELDGGNAQICRRKNTGKESTPCRKLKMSPSSLPR